MSIRTPRPSRDRAVSQHHDFPQDLPRGGPLGIPSRRGSRAGLAAIALFAVALAGCGQGTSSHRELSQRERDSTLGKSVIPGAAAVTRTLAESDKAARAAGQLDAQVDSLTR